MSKHETEATFVRHEPCPQCGSNNNLARYSDGHGYCFSFGCEYYEPGEGAPKQSQRETKRLSSLISGVCEALPKRAISEETCKHWNYQKGRYDDRPVQIANYYDADGSVVAQKIRFADKEFKFVGEPKKALPLYGQHLWRDGGKMLVITEGEIDALSVSHLQGNKWPVVSVPNGAQGGSKSVSKAIEWLEKFEKVIFMFDMDEPGRAAAKECAALLTPGKAFIASLPLKDANDCLISGKGSAVIDAIWGAKAYRPDGVVLAEDIFDDAFEDAVLGIPWPWAPLTEKTYGIRSAELYAFGGGVGCGKSDVFKEIALHLMGLGHKCGYLAFEEKPKHSLKVITGKYLGKRIHVPGITASPEEKARAREYFNGKFALFDHFGAMDYQTAKERMRYMVVSLGCKFIFLDHLTALAAAIETDERKAIDKIMADLSAFTQQLDFTLFFVSHLTTPEGKPHEEGGRVLEKHFRGSRSIAQWAHFMFGIERDKQKPNEPTTFRVLKDRYTGDANGVVFGLGYDRETGRVFECELPDRDDDTPKFRDETGTDVDF